MFLIVFLFALMLFYHILLNMGHLLGNVFFFSSPQFLEIIILTLPLCWAVPSQCGTSKFSGEDRLDFFVTFLPEPKTLKMLLFSSLRQFSSNESYWASMQPSQILFKAFTFTVFFVL